MRYSDKSSYEKLESLCRNVTAYRGTTDAIENTSLLEDKINNDESLLYCNKFEDIGELASLGWLLGKKANIVTPFIDFARTTIDQTYGWDHSPQTTNYIHTEYLNWKKLLEQESLPFSLHNAINVELEHEYDDGDDNEDGMTMHLSYGARVNPRLLMHKNWLTTTDISLLEKIDEITIPTTLIKNPKIIEKVMDESPRSAQSFNQIMKKTYQEFKQSNPNMPLKVLLEKIHDEIISPNVKIIAKERRSLLMHKTLRSVSENVMLTLPLFATKNYNTYLSLLSAFVAAGIGKKFISDLFDILKDLREQHKDPYFVAYHLGLGKKSLFK